MRISLPLYTAALVVAGVLSPLAGAATGNVDLPRYPSISPDGKEIGFSWRGDLWKVASSGGLAVRLTSHPATETRNTWSPDGRQIAFNSTRLGGNNIFVMNADGTSVRPVTTSDRKNDLSGFATDGKRILFSAMRESDNYRSPRPYVVGIDGGPIERLLDCFGENPQTSPDGARIIFERGTSEWSRRNYRGPDQRDIYLYDTGDKSFKRLTAWNGNDGKAHWRDDKTIVFLSDRELSTTNLYQMRLEDGEAKLKRLTSFEGQDVIDFDVSRDGASAVFQVWDTLYAISLKQSDPRPVALTINAPEDLSDNFQFKSVSKDVSDAALSPDGKTLAVVAYGEVYIRSTDEKALTRRVTNDSARARELAWSPDGVKLYFSSDLDGGDGIYVATVEATRDEIKDEIKKAVSPTPTEPAATATSKDAAPAAATEKPTDPAPAATEPGAAAGAQEPAKDPAAPSAAPPAAEKASEKKEPDTAKQAERWRSAIRFKTEPVNTGRKPGLGGDDDRNPSPSPDGKSLAFRRSRGDIMVLDLASGATRKLVENWDYSVEWRWSPDSHWVAYSASDDNFNTDVWLIRADGSKPATNITRHPDDDRSPRWSADGRILAFLSNREGDKFDVWAVNLDAELDSYTREDLEKYFKDATDAAKKRTPLGAKKEKKDESKKDDAKRDDSKKEDPKKEDGKKDEAKKAEPPFEPSLDDAYLRLRRITSMAGDELNLELTPGGDRFIFTGNDKGEGGEGLYSIKWNGDEKERKRLADGSGVRVEGVSLTGDKVVYIDKGSANLVPPDGGKVEPMGIDDRQKIDLQKQAVQKFTEAVRVLGECFYHPTMKGLDWPTLGKKYLQLASQSRTKEEFGAIGMRLVGELNASHLGVYPSPEDIAGAEPSGRLGLDVRAAMSPDRVFIVDAIVPRGPCSKGLMALKPGDIITAIDFQKFEASDTLESRLRGKVGKEVTLTIKRASAQENDPRVELNVLTTPVSYDADGDLRYDWWTRKNAEYVSQVSGGKIGYLHIRGMGEPNLVDFERDLYAAAEGKAGLLIDVRNNGGGWTADRVLASLMVGSHAYTVPRGGKVNPDAYPRDRLYIQRYTKPVNMLCNEKSFSNAEIISHAFKTLKRGHLCGQQTYGGVISTDGTNLIDGTLVRLPFRGWFLPDGTDMENHGAMPDVLTPQTPEDESAGLDRQLKDATEDLMKRLS